MATFEDGEAGWEFYKDSDYALSLGEINDRLVGTGFSPVSGRMFRHYLKLARYGFEYYIPINQLDVKTLQNPVWDRAIRGRYLPRRLSVPVILRLLVNEQVIEFSGLASEVSEGEGVVRLNGEEAVSFFEGLGRTKPFAEVVFSTDGEVVFGQIERIVLETEQMFATVKIGFLHMAAPEGVFAGTSLETTALHVRLGGTDTPIPLTSLVQVLFWLVQGLEACRVAAQDLLEQLDPEQSIELPPPRVVSVRMASPLDAVIQVAWPYGAAFVTIYGSYLKLSKTWWEREVSRETALKLRWENEQKGIARRFQPKVVVEFLIGTLRDTLRQKGKDVPEAQALDTERAETLIEKQAFQAVRELDTATQGQLELDFPTEQVPEVEAIEPVPERRRTAAAAQTPSPRAVRARTTAEDDP